jgi:hypothetical protein
MRNAGGRFGQRSECYSPSQVDRPLVERAIGELLRFAAQVGVSGVDLIGMLNRGMSVPEILSILKQKTRGRSH